MKQDDKKDALVGSLWVKKYDGGGQFISGYINGKRVVIRVNRQKKKDNSPDLLVFQTEGDDDVEF